MTSCLARLRYSPTYELNIDLEDNMVFDASATRNFGKQVFFRKNPVGYYHNAYRNLYIHQLIADACVWNDRPDLYNVVDHINGDRSDNRPRNLRHVNTHINLNNRHHDPTTQTPPGLTHETAPLKDGRFWTSWVFRKNGCALRYFKKKQIAVDFANDFNATYVARLIEAYNSSPENGDIDEWRVYWRTRLISLNAFRKTDREDVLFFRKFIVSAEKFRAMTGLI